ncbi:MAG: cupin domain-containing protein [Candidatus Rokubacteria bacterium]|nr:cupin domain-containing protein [Candidatus Rokubacteria bacterium]
MKIRVRDHAKFRDDKMAKIALATTARAQLDLYCLAPGQEQKPHAHDDQDKIYVVVEGRGEVVVDGARETLEAGEAVVAPSGSQHGLRNPGPGPLLALVVVTPPPPHA